MLPTDLPQGTTLDTLLTYCLPAMHARLVTSNAQEPAIVHVYLGGAKNYTLTVRGQTLEVADSLEDQPDLWVSVRAETAQALIDDWLGPGRFRPPAPPPGGWVALTDPRILSRLAMVNGCVELGLSDFQGDRLYVTMAVGEAAKKEVDDVEPDVVVEASANALERMIAGKLAPDEAIANGHVRVQGKKLIGLQFAFAVAPFFPKREGREGGTES